MKKVQFNINYKTKLGEQLFIKIADHDSDRHNELKMHYVENGFWHLEAEVTANDIVYHYLLKDENGSVLDEEMNSHELILGTTFSNYHVLDFWNKKNFPENYLNNKILKNHLGKVKFKKIKPKKKDTHLFSIQAPLYNTDERIVLLGSANALGAWDETKFVSLQQVDEVTWETACNISEVSGVVAYKYAVYNEKLKTLKYEFGDNRLAQINTNPDTLFVYHDHYLQYHKEDLWHAAGVAIPVFALRSDRGFGVGEFEDLKLLADWASKTKLSVLQILPINDTTANHTWTDSYPYAAISVYALHPQYLAIDHLTYSLPKASIEEFHKERKRINLLEQIDYEAVMQGKWKFLKAVFEENKAKILLDKKFEKYRNENSKWLLPYAVFCTLRDKYKTPDFSKWRVLSKFVPKKVEEYFKTSNKDYETAMFHAWIQYELHVQLMDAVDYIHTKDIALKGDLPIGIYRYSVDAWVDPYLFGMNFQAGAPPDEFTDLGQNWEFPTYNWEVMKEDGYQWWKNRFKALGQYFDAMRIDHILGFFRIWRMPASAVQGILGYFYPALPVTREEMNNRGIWFDHNRYTKPFINDEILWFTFGEQKGDVVEKFLNEEHGHYHFKPEYDTQRKVEAYFKGFPEEKEVKEKLYALLANVLFLEEQTEFGVAYHPRFNLHKTMSYKYLDHDLQRKLYDLYVDYFFRRQDEMWKENAMEKLPMLLEATDMLICGEDLGLVPDCVPQVMDDLAIVALKVQRSPKENVPFYNPKDVGYLNVVTYSSHDSSTLRQWWKEDRQLTQRYFSEQLQQHGAAPEELTPPLAEIVMKQHLYNNAMLAIFPIQEYFATDWFIRQAEDENERINIPAIFPHYWRYRMHIELEQLLDKEEFNNKISGWIVDSGRAKN